uniref:Uncharacterized protein n=1 Tax=Ditylenchus dipsaci TaxID=166011 RepID=A0A915DUE9_9BILA
MEGFNSYDYIIYSDTVKSSSYSSSELGLEISPARYEQALRELEQTSAYIFREPVAIDTQADLSAALDSFTDDSDIPEDMIPVASDLVLMPEAKGKTSSDNSSPSDNGVAVADEDVLLSSMLPIPEDFLPKDLAPFKERFIDFQDITSEESPAIQCAQ